MKKGKALTVNASYLDPVFFVALGFNAAKHCAQREFPRFHPSFLANNNQMIYYYTRSGDGLCIAGADVVVIHTAHLRKKIQLFRYSLDELLREIDCRSDKPFATGSEALEFLIEEYAIPNPRIHLVETQSYCVVKE